NSESTANQRSGTDKAAVPTAASSLPTACQLMFAIPSTETRTASAVPASAARGAGAWKPSRCERAFLCRTAGSHTQAATLTSPRLRASHRGITRRPQSPGRRIVASSVMAMLTYGTHTSLSSTRHRSARSPFLVTSTSSKLTKSRMEDVLPLLAGDDRDGADVVAGAVHAVGLEALAAEVIVAGDAEELDLPRLTPLTRDGAAVHLRQAAVGRHDHRAVVQEERAGVCGHGGRVDRIELRLGHGVGGLRVFAPHVVRLDQEGLAAADPDRHPGRELPVGLGVLGLGDQLPLVPVEGERAELGRPLDGARVGAEEDHVVAALARHRDVDAAHLHGMGGPVLLEAGEVLACALEG